MSIRMPHNVLAGDIIHSVGTSAPGSPLTGTIWLDTSVTPNLLKVWDGAAWQGIGGGISSVATPLTLTAGALDIQQASASLEGSMSAAAFTKLATLKVPAVALNVAAGTDILSGAALTANTYADLWANQNFTATATGVYLVLVRLAVLVTGVGGAGSMTTRAVINSAGTPINVKLAGSAFPASGQVATGTAAFMLGPGLPAGTNTIKLQVLSTTSASAYCRALTVQTTEFAEIAIWELAV